MPRLIDADKLKAHYAWWGECSEMAKKNKEVFDTIVNLQPTVEAVEVVRCKECIHWDTDWETLPGFHYCPMVDGLKNGEWFCADGERREDEHIG